MVELEDIPKGWQPPERPWFSIRTATDKQEEVIREFAREEGFEDLRGYWSHMQSEDWDYYDVIRMYYE